MMKRVLITTSRDDVRRILDQIPYQASYFTGDTRTTTYHYSVRTGPHQFQDLARVTWNDAKKHYTVRLLAD